MKVGAIIIKKTKRQQGFSILFECNYCHKRKLTSMWYIKNGEGRYCSRSCKDKYQKTKQKEQATRWAGNKVGYQGIHLWLDQNYNKANKCENIDCKHISNNYNWCLKRKCKHERKRGNYIKLCRSCHCIYDRGNYKLIKIL